MGAVAVGAALHPLMQLARRRSWVAFVDTSPEKFADSLLGCYPRHAAHCPAHIMQYHVLSFQYDQIFQVKPYSFAEYLCDTR